MLHFYFGIKVCNSKACIVWHVAIFVADTISDKAQGDQVGNYRGHITAHLHSKRLDL